MIRAQHGSAYSGSPLRQGRHIIISAFLDHEAQKSLGGTRVRLFRPGAKLAGTYGSMMTLEMAELNRPFGRDDEILAITTNEEHACNARTVVWFLPGHGKPKQLLDIPGSLGHFVRRSAEGDGGICVERQTYDGIHAETKGLVPEFWRRNERRNTLRLAGHA